MTNEKSTKAEPDKIEVVLRDLENLLRIKLGRGLIVDSFATSNLVSMGENYGSTMLKVEANIRRKGPTSKPEELSLVAKMIPPTEIQKMLFDSPFTFRKEIYMFTDIVPAYKALELEHGIPEAEVFDLLPKFYGARLSLIEGEEKFDDDAVILMENLKTKNYACVDRKVGFDLEPAKSVVEALAHFHALGMALKLKNPEFFEDVKVHAKSMALPETFITDAGNSIVSDAKKIPALFPHLQRIEDSLQRMKDGSSCVEPPVEPWATIIHADFWVNNIMLSMGESSDATEIKFVDFQNYLYQNPMRDLIFFIFSSCGKSVRDNHVEALINIYYDKLVCYLEILGCDGGLLTRTSFEENLSDAASFEYGHCITMSRVIHAEQNDPGVNNLGLMFAGGLSDRCRELMIEVTLKFIEKNWI